MKITHSCCCTLSKFIIDDSFSSFLVLKLKLVIEFSFLQNNSTSSSKSHQIYFLLRNVIKLERQMWVEAIIVSRTGGWSHGTGIQNGPRRMQGRGSCGDGVRLASVSSVSNSIRLVKTLSVLGSPCLICETLPTCKCDC